MSKTNEQKRSRKKKIKIEYIQPQYLTWTGGTSFSPNYLPQTTATPALQTTTIDGYDYVTIRDLIYKINEIVRVLNGDKLH